MDDAHAHPPSPAYSLHSRSRSIPPSLRDLQPNNTTPKSAPHTRQQRLLQTRHARFSAQSLSVNGINTPYLQLNRSCENESPYFPSPRFKRRDENDRAQTKPEELSNASTESAILNEISNSNAYRIRGLKRRAAIPVFEDSPGKHSNPHSIYQDVSGDIHTPSLSDSARDNSPTMGLREVSLNIQRPSPGKRRTLSRKSSLVRPTFNPDDYIDHIENELQTVKDAMYSPTTHLPWKDKLKKAKEEIQRLKKELESTKASFEYELHQAVERSAETELKLKRKIKDLEDDVELKQSVIHDLEYDCQEKRLDQTALDSLKARIEKLEDEKLSLEATNRDMTKRNEVLTHLLALSPTKTQPAIELATPRRRSARPMSLIIPRVPSSPGIRTCQPHSRPQSILVSPAIGASDYFGAQIPSSPLASSPVGLDDAQSIDSGLGESCAPMASGTGSRRSTMASHVSTSPSMDAGGHARAESRSQTVLRHPSKRRPRKFMPGSTQLKPLLLPTFTADSGNLPLTSPVASPTHPVPVHSNFQQNAYHVTRIEQPAIDEYDEATCSSPDQVIGRPGPAFQSLDEVFAEDANKFRLVELEETLTKLSISNQSRQYESPIQNNDFLPIKDDQSPVGPHSHPGIDSWVWKTISSYSEFAEGNSKVVAPGPLVLSDNVEIPQPLFSRHRTGVDRCSSHNAFPDSPLHLRQRRKTSSSVEAYRAGTDCTDDMYTGSERRTIDCQDLEMATSSSKEKTSNPLNRQSAHRDRQGTARARNPLEILQHRGIGTRPLAALTIQTVYATVSRYTSYVQGFKRDPLALARRVIANAWRSNWSVFGKLSWWVLGLFIGHRRPPSGYLEWNWERYDGESIANQHCYPHVNDPSVSELRTRASQDAPAPMTEASGKSGRRPGESSPSNSTAAKEPKDGWGRSLFLWGKFSVAIMLAVGGAIVKGPAEMLREADERRRSRRNSLATDSDISDGGRHLELSNADNKDVGIHPLPEKPPDGKRKARSFSSPPTSPETHDRAIYPTGQHSSEEHGFLTRTHQASCRPTLPAEPSPSNDNTLKPARSERKAVDSLFDSPEDIEIGASSSPGKLSMLTIRAAGCCGD
ncbi:hypothetical protein G647_01986 [Cladophialophora carrionii CBS 160.54]|uniref:Uncharacterized protein n=1 Tax=Cladophialophora carrionii CBS 160.54 TaxID=1279043 RepID=V9DT82_9EURO|nr:uncharacterized protein G647_01986 [Cladophialophora carrionii CBS 160.54]ETI29533.1 hypothetical protein G647_01986 [Cladophialophora carrionii CBS 160.54]